MNTLIRPLLVHQTRRFATSSSSTISLRPSSSLLSSSSSSSPLLRPSSFSLLCPSSFSSTFSRRTLSPLLAHHSYSTMSPAHKLCMIPGPIEFHEDVLQAMATPATSHVAPNFIPAFGESIELLRKVLFTSGQPFIIAGSGTLGWDMTACNLVEAGEDVLVCNSGYFGDRFGECLETYGAKVTHLRVPIGESPKLAAVAAALKAKKFKAITITHVDTSTGVLSDIRGIAEVVRAESPETLVVVDGVCSVGSEEIRMDAWGIDVVVTASQKALGAPPGLCIMGVSERAIGVFKARKTPVANYYANWNRWLPIMNAYESRKPSYFATPAVQNVFALHVSLKQIVEQGVEQRFVAHKEASAKAKKFIHDLGLTLVPTKVEHAANGMSAVYYPEGVAATDLLPKLAAHGIVAAGGLHVEIAPKYFRIGHMGISVTEPERGHLDATLNALKASLAECGYKGAL